MTRAIVYRTAGDQAMARAIVDGMMAVDAKRPMTNTAALVRVAVGNSKTAEDYAMMSIKARYAYEDNPVHGRLYWALLIFWATMWTEIGDWWDYFRAWNRGRV